MEFNKRKNLKKPKTFIAKTTIVIGCILLMVACTMTIKNNIENRNAGRVSEKIIDYMENKNNESKNCDNESNQTDGYCESEKYIEFADDNKSNLTNSYCESDKFIEFAGEKYVGILSVPSLNIKLPINEKWSYEQLKKTPCVYSGNVGEAGFVIAAHNYSTHFGKIKYLRKGDEIIYKGVNGSTFSYKVESVENLLPTQVESVISKEYELTLFTCTFNGQARVVARCKVY